MYLPEKFERKMQDILGDEYQEYVDCYEAPRYYGLRVNTKKISVEDLSLIHILTTGLSNNLTVKAVRQAVEQLNLTTDRLPEELRMKYEPVSYTHLQRTG